MQRLAEAAIERRGELTEPELLQLLSSFAAMGRWFFDNRLLDGLTAGEFVTHVTNNMLWTGADGGQGLVSRQYALRTTCAGFKLPL
jgi:hypothetical protein